jgi:hypothetical protein
MESQLCPSFDTQFCIVSEQAIPNLTPLLDSRLRPSTRRVVLFVTRRMERQAGWLQQILERHQIEPKRVPLHEKAEYPDLVKTFQEQLDQFPNAILNATGGKKNMTVAAHSVFVRAGRPVFYVETDNTLHWMMEGQPQSAFSLEATLDLETLLNAYGYAIADKLDTIDQSQLDFATTIFAQPKQYAQAITDLAFDNRSASSRKIYSKRTGNLGAEQVKLLKIAEKSGITKQERQTWNCSKAAARFISGEWLEIYIQAILRDRFRIRNVYRSIRINRIDEATTSNANTSIANEIDVAFTKNNQLYLVECKALSPEKNSASKNRSTNEFIYTLDAIKKSGGLNTKAALVVWGAELGPGSRKRAEEYKIKIFTCSDPLNFSSELQAWVDQR